MKFWVELCSRGARNLASWVFSFALWTLWLALATLFVGQLYILTANELTIPDFLLRQLESRLAESGVRATFSRTSFDPAGRILIENVRLSLPAFEEPIVTARSVYVRLNPLMLIVGRVEPRDIQVEGVTAAVPAMLSPSGRPEEIIHQLAATLEFQRRAIGITQLSARIAGVAVSAHGTLMLTPGESPKPPLDTFADFVAHRFPRLCRQALVWTEQIAQLEAPALHLEFAPSESGATTIQVLALARAARVTQPLTAEAMDLRASTRLLLFGDAPPSDIELFVGELRLPENSMARGINARVLGRVLLDGTQFNLREVMLTTDSFTTAGVDAGVISAQIFPHALPAIEANVTGNFLGAPLALHAEGDVNARQGLIQFRGEISPRVLDVISQRVGVNVRKFYDFDAMTAEQAEARFGPGGKFEKLTARVRIPRMNSYGVIMEDGRAAIELEPGRFYSPEAFARVGENFAYGTYEHDLKTHDYRFLLQGRLQPLAISVWFHDWWSHFFEQLVFPAAPPDASVDVRGSWRDGHRSNVFVFADAGRSIIRGTEFDRMRTRLFIRPAFYDGLEILATRGRGDAHGRFTYIADPDTHAWHTLDLGLDSTLDLKIATDLLGPSIAKTLQPIRLAAPPALKLQGQFSGPAAPGGASEKLHIEARTTGEFRFHEFPLQDVSFKASLDHDELVLDDIEARFGGGQASGHARVWGTGEQRRLGFDVALNDANLGQVVAGLGEGFAAQKGQSATPPGKFVQEKANVQLNLAASAEGRYDDPLSYRGDGNAVLRGAEIGEVPLLGTLSDLLKFTALRFTEARANFKIEGTKLVFPTVTLRGANSAIDAHGLYALDRRELDFNAKIFPFQESENLIKSVVSAVLTPLSNAFEVKLTGSLTKPNWAFVMGPTNLLRSLSPTPESASTKAEGSADDNIARPSPPTAGKGNSEAAPRP